MALKSGDKVGIVSPSSFLPNHECIELGIDYLESLGFEVVIGKHVYSKYRYTAGTPQEQAEDIMNFYQDPSIKAIFTSSAGFGSQKILPFLDYEIIKNNPKPFFGFSDTTALQLAIYAKTQNITYTGFLLKYDFKFGHIDAMVEDSLKTHLAGEKLIARGGETVKGGKTQGILVGGCLSLFRNLCGTQYYPDLTDAILLIEDECEKTYKIDFMLEQIKLCPNFDKVKGIVFGQFSESEIRIPEDGDIDENIRYFTKSLNIPIIKNFPYGHFPSRYVLPIGAKVNFDADNCILEFI